MRTISSNALAELATKLGTEPINIIDVNWSSNKITQYADRQIGSIKGRILQIDELDNVVNVLLNSNSQSIDIILDDTDGSIKAIMDSHDVNKRNVWVYQYFEGLDLSDRFLLFQGKINSPIIWNEGDRTVSFTVVSQIEDKEIGFSAEEGDFPFIPKDLVGKPWPIIFGKVADVPALQVNHAVTGSTLCGVGIVSGEDQHNAVNLSEDDCSLGGGLAVMQAQAHHLQGVAACFARVGMMKQANQYNDQAEEIYAQISATAAQQASSNECAQTKRAQTINDAKNQGEGCNPIRILGGEDFPQDTPIVLNINGGLFTGTMHEDNFTVSTRRHPENEDEADKAFNAITGSICEGAQSRPPSWDITTNVPPGTGDLTDPQQDTFRSHGFVVCLTTPKNQPPDGQVAQHFWAEAGSQVTLASDEPITYIVSITPGTVLAVKAYKQFTGQKRLVNVPRDLWRVQTTDYGPVTAVEVVIDKPLSTLVDEGWEDQIYVTFESDIGPDTIEIMQYIIQRWTDLDWDNDSFDEVQDKLEPFPMNFAILDRRNTIDVLKDMAWQARCAIWLSNGNFFLKYLPDEPSSDSTMTVSDILPKTFEIELSGTEDIYTKLIVTWKVSYADGNGETPNKMILRHNIKKYGTRQKEVDFYCYNQPDIILKAATFWLIRMANSWKKVSFSTPIHKLNLETFDTVTLPAGYASTASVKATVEEASYDSAENQINFKVQTPVKAGTMAAYKFYWPAAVSDEFPTTEEIQSGNAGGLNTIEVLPIGDTSKILDGGSIFVGGPNVVFRQNSGRGDKRPGDLGFTAQQIILPSTYADVTNTRNPKPNLRLNYAKQIKPPAMPTMPQTPIIIDIAKTRVIDSDSGKPPLSNLAYFKSVFGQIKDGNLWLRDVQRITDSNSHEATFTFKYDDKGGKFGAERAFLIPAG